MSDRENDPDYLLKFLFVSRIALHPFFNPFYCCTAFGQIKHRDSETIRQVDRLPRATGTTAALVGFFGAVRCPTNNEVGGAAHVGAKYLVAVSCHQLLCARFKISPSVMDNFCNPECFR